MAALKYIHKFLDTFPFKRWSPPFDWTGLIESLLKNGLWQSDDVCLRRQGHKIHCGLLLAIIWITHSGVSQAAL